MTDKQIQKAGDNSSQFQAQNQSIVVNNGISEERVHAIVDEECERSRAECWCKGPLPLPQKAGSGYRLEF